MDYEVDYYPSQIIETIGDVTFSSTFDAGNLKGVRKDGINKYILTICNDTGINGKQATYRTWFYFSVEGIDNSQLVTFVISNMQNQIGLFRDGMQPVFKSNNEWQRVRYPCQYRLLPDGLFEVTFQHLFQNSAKVYFAFTYPWSNLDNNQFIQQMIQQGKQQINSLYIKQNILGYSKERRPIHLITITNQNNCTNKIEENINNAFPDTTESRPLIFKKKYIFISARVHPGELPGSHTLNGIIKFLLNPNDKSAEIARNEFVWVFVPIINPDGVYRGHYRTDSLCQNLNRYYLNPSLNDHPTIYSIKEYLLRLHQTDRLYSYVDLHAHAGHKGIFIFGNQLPNLYMHTLSCLFPKLLTLYSEIFDYDGCNFTEKNMYSADKGDGLSKEGSGRVAIYKETNLILSYTVECNYNSGKITNILPKSTFLSDQDDINNTYGNEQIDENIVLGLSQQTTTNKTYFYTISDYELAGKAIVLSFLDMNLINPCSKLPDSQFKTLSNLKTYMGYNILKVMQFRFDSYFRKVLKNINNKEQIQRTLRSLHEYLKYGQIKDNLDQNEQQFLQKQNLQRRPQQQQQNQEQKLQKHTLQLQSQKLEKLPEINQKYQSQRQQQSQDKSKNRQNSETKQKTPQLQQFKSFKIQNSTKTHLQKQ